MASLGEIALGSILGFDIQNSMAASSNYGSLHPDLFAVLTQVDANGMPTGVSVKAPVKEGSIEQEFNWTSPFENMTAESQHPTLMALAQSGGLTELIQSLGSTAFAEKAPETMKKIESVKGELLRLSDYGKGRTGITKLNSRQVFTGHSPLKINMTLLFRAWQDPLSEVADPFLKLLRMAYPEKIAENIFESASRSDTIGDAVVKALFPSKAPLPIIMTYKGEQYPKLVIESIGKPLDAPYSPMGDIWLEVPIVLQSWQSLDYQDMKSMQTTGIGSLVSEAIDAITDLF